MDEYKLVPKDDELRHYGVLGMKWGVRRASKYRSKASSAYENSKKHYRTAQNSSNSAFGSAKKTIKRSLKAAEAANRATKYSEKADRIEQTNKRKAAKKEAKLDKKIRKSSDPEKTKALKEKAKKFTDSRIKLLDSMSESQTSKYYEHNDRVYTFVDQMDKRMQMEERILSRK